MPGTDTPGTVDGGTNDRLRDARNPGDHRLDRLVIRVGGALGSAVVSGLQRELGDTAMPVINAQPRATIHSSSPGTARRNSATCSPPTPSERLPPKRSVGCRPNPVERCRWLAADPDRYMAPWPTEPASYATGILDDITYDWLPIVDGMLATGSLLVATDDDFRAAHRLGHTHTSIPVRPTGAAGLGGLLALQRMSPSTSPANAASSSAVTSVPEIRFRAEISSAGSAEGCVAVRS